MRERKTSRKQKRELRENMENQSMVGFHPGAEVDLDCFLLSLLSEEIQDDQACVITESLQLQKSILASLIVSDSDDTAAVDVISAGISSSKTALLADHSAAKDENCSFLEKALMASLIITDSEDTAGVVNVAGKVKEENCSTSLIITDSGSDKDAVGKSSLETTILPDDFAAEEEDYQFLIIEVCKLCATPEVEDKLIRVSGCRHSFCQQCFERVKKTDIVPLCMAIGMIGASISFGILTAKQQLRYSPNVYVKKSRRETLPEVVEPDHVVEKADRFINNSFFRKVVHIKDKSVNSTSTNKFPSC